MNELDKFDRYTGSKEDIRTGFGGDWTDHKVGRGQAIDRRDVPIYGEKVRNLEYSRALMHDLEGLIIRKDMRDKSPNEMPDNLNTDAEFREKGAKYLQDIVKRFNPNKQNEFYRLLSNMENVFRLGGEDRGRELYNKTHKDMQNFLQENLTSPMEPVKLRRIEDKVMDGFIQQDTKYNMGE